MNENKLSHEYNSQHVMPHENMNEHMNLTNTKQNACTTYENNNQHHIINNYDVINDNNTSMHESSTCTAQNHFINNNNQQQHKTMKCEYKACYNNKNDETTNIHQNLLLKMHIPDHDCSLFPEFDENDYSL